MRMFMTAIYVTFNAEGLIFCNYILNCILIKKLKIGSQFEKNNKWQPLQGICDTKRILF